MIYIASQFGMGKWYPHPQTAQQVSHRSAYTLTSSLFAADRALSCADMTDEVSLIRSFFF